MIRGDSYRIVPRTALDATVVPLDLQIRYLVKSDINYMRDRLRADLFASGVSTGIYAAADVTKDMSRPILSGQDIIDRYAPELQRRIVGAMFSGAPRHDQDALAIRTELLEERLQHLERRRWWHIRRNFNAWKAGSL